MSNEFSEIEKARASLEKAKKKTSPKQSPLASSMQRMMCYRMIDVLGFTR